MKKLLLIGAGSGSREILMLIDRINQRAPEWEVLGFVDEDPKLVGTQVDGYPVLGTSHDIAGDDVYGACGVMEPATRKRLLEEHVERRGFRLPILIAPDVVVPRDFKADVGIVIMPSVTISFDVQLAKGVFVLWGSALGHHLRVGEFTTILTYALITGGCTIGARTIIGSRATINGGVKVGDDALVGIGTTVLHNVAAGKRIVAMPRMIET